MKKQDEARKMALEALCEAPPLHLLDNPLEYIFADHFRQRVLCSVLDEIFDADAMNGELVSAVRRFLIEDMKYHIADEEENLFPLLRQRAEPDDQVDEILDRLSEEHKSDHIDAKLIIRELENLHNGDSKYPIHPETKQMVNRFTANERHHLIVENAIVMPLAKARFTSEDLHNIALDMAARRGLDYSGNK